MSQPVIITFGFVLLSVLLAGCGLGSSGGGTGGAGGAGGTGGTGGANQTVAQLKANIENNHPATYYQLAGKLFEDGQKDEAVFWFYLGQLRYRFHLATAKDLDPSGDPALFGSLSQVVGQPVNEYAFGDIPRLAKTIDEVLAWDDSHANGFTAKAGNEAALQTVRKGLADLKVYVVQNEADIMAQRKANGL